MFYGQYTGFGAGGSDQGGAYGVSQSILFNDDDSPRMFRTPSSAGNLKTWTFSAWFKRAGFSTIQTLFNSGASEDLAFNAADQLIMNMGTSNYISTRVFRDPTTWYSLIVAVDTTNATASSRVRFYLDGAEITDFDTETNPAENENLTVNSAVRHTIGANEGNTEEFDGYLADVHFVDGSVLTAASFGELNSDNVWVPIRYTGNYGTNGFQIQGATASALGTDTSGQGNTYTTAGLTTADKTLESPVDDPALGAGNFTIITPLYANSSIVFSEGNQKLNLTSFSMTAWSSVDLPTSGKFYIEMECVSGNFFNCGFGGSKREHGLGVFDARLTDEWYVRGDNDVGLLRRLDGGTSTNDDIETDLNAGRTLMIAYDADNNCVWAGVDGVWVSWNNSSTASNTILAQIEAGTTEHAAINDPIIGEANMAIAMNESSAESTVSIMRFGATGFNYTPPTNFLSLSSLNLTGAVTSIPASGNWKDIDANCTFATGTLDTNGTGAGRTVDTFPGNFEVSFTITAEVDMSFGVYAMVEDNTYNNSTSNGSMSSMSISFYYSGDDNSIKYGSSVQSTGNTWSSGNTAKITREGDVIIIYKNNVVLWQFTQRYGGPMRLVLGSGGGTTNIDDIALIK